MKIQANDLVNFLEKTSLKGNINTAVLEFNAQGLKVQVQTSNIAFVKGELKKEVFKEYEAIGQVGIKNVQMFNALLKRYGSNIVSLKKENNVLKIISETGSTFYVLCEPEMVDNYIDKEITLEKLDKGFEIDSAKLSSIKTAGDILKVNEILIEIKENKLVMTTSNDIGDKITEEVAVEYKDVKGKYGELLQKIIEVISGKVKISLDVEYPIKVSENKESYSIEYIVAPMVTEE